MCVFCFRVACVCVRVFLDTCGDACQHATLHVCCALMHVCAHIWLSHLYACMSEWTHASMPARTYMRVCVCWQAAFAE